MSLKLPETLTQAIWANQLITPVLPAYPGKNTKSAKTPTNIECKVHIDARPAQRYIFTRAEAASGKYGYNPGSLAQYSKRVAHRVIPSRPGQDSGSQDSGDCGEVCMSKCMSECMVVFTNPVHVMRDRLPGCLLLVIMACLSLACPDTRAASATDTPAEDVVPVFEPVASTWGPLQMAQDVSIVMRDGIRLSIDVFRPDDNIAHPVLYAAGPYPHTRAILADSATTVGPIAWYVSQGYAVVLVSVRGTGLSTGEFTFMGRQEQQDHYEVVQWITTQPWSDGQVAGLGAGYYAASQWQLAIQNPQGLACIAPINGTLDPYREWVAPGGLGNDAFMGNWYEEKVRLPNAFASEAPRLIDYDLRLAWLSHPTWDSYWQERASRESTHLISVPIFAIHDWNQDRMAAGFTTTLNSMGRLNVMNKVMVASPPDDVGLYQDTGFLARELLPYYQWCFTGKSTTSPYIERPRVQYQVRGQNSIRRDSTWPPGNISFQSWFTAKAGTSDIGSLSETQAIGGAGFTNLERSDNGNVLRFESGPLAQDLQITGPVMMELFAATTGNDMAFEVTLKEEIRYQLPLSATFLPGILDNLSDKSLSSEEASTEILVTRGRLKASVRQKDLTRSSDNLPVYTLDQPDLLSPGQVYPLEIALRQTAYRFSAGNRVVLEVRPVNDGSLANSVRDTLYHNTRNPSRLWLPVVPNPQVSEPGTSQNLGPFRRDSRNAGRSSNPNTTPASNAAGNTDSPFIFVPQ